MSSSSLNLPQTTSSAITALPAISAPSSSAQLIPQSRLWPLSVEQYHQIAEHGIIHEVEPVELLDGLLIRKLDYFPEFASLEPVRHDDGTLLIPFEWLYPITVEQYHQIAKLGILKDGDPVELLEGRLFRKMTKNPRHVNALRILRRRLEAQLAEPFLLNIQDPVTLPSSEPEPDLSIFREYQDTSSRRYPEPADIALLVEVSDTTLSQDQGRKLRSYAAASIVHFWIVNLIDNRIEWYSEPTGETVMPATYRQRVDYPLGSTLLFPLGEQELRIDVDGRLIPPV